MTKSAAEEFLIEQEFIIKRSAQRRRVLGCIACRWRDCQKKQQPQQVYAYQIMKCTGIKSGIVVPHLNSLEEMGIITSSREPSDTSPNQIKRRVYAPAETATGQEFADILSLPQFCPLDRSIRAGGLEKVVRAALLDALIDSDPDELRVIIALATQRLEELGEST